MDQKFVGYMLCENPREMGCECCDLTIKNAEFQHLKRWNHQKQKRRELPFLNVVHHKKKHKDFPFKTWGIIFKKMQ